MQTELFEWSSRTVHEEQPVPKISFLEKTFVTLRRDQTIGLVLVLLVFYVLTFAWGVERGKRTAFEGHVLKQAPAAAPSQVVVEPRTVKVEEPAPAVFASESVPSEVAIPVTALPKPVATVVKAAPPAAAKPNGKFTIQHVTYITQSAADREIQKLAKLGYASFVIPSGKHLQVCIASAQTRQEASQVLKQLRGQRIVSGDAYVRPIPG